MLADYLHNIILKLIEHVRDFEVIEQILQTYMEKCKLPAPIKPIGYHDLLDAIKFRSYYCIQDDKAKRHIDYFNHKHYTPSIILNESIRNVDAAVARYQAAHTIDADQIENLSQSLNQMLILISNRISQFYLANSYELEQDPSLEDFKTFCPNRDYLTMLDYSIVMCQV